MGKSTINGPCSIAFCMFTRPGHHLSRPPKGQSPKPSPKAYLRTQESSHRWNHPGKSPSVVVPSLVMVGLWHWHGIGLYWVYRISISTYISTNINLYHCWNSISLVVKKTKTKRIRASSGLSSQLFGNTKPVLDQCIITSEQVKWLKGWYEETQQMQGDQRCS